jgi:hypothetical protein
MTRYNADLDAIKGLRAALETFAARQSDALGATENEIILTVTLLEQAEQDWRYQVEQRQQELRNCYAMNFITGIDCSAEAAALREAEEKLSKITRMRARVQDALVEYRTAGEHFSSVLENELPHARAYLNDRIAALETYAATLVSQANSAPTPASPAISNDPPIVARRAAGASAPPENPAGHRGDAERKG